VSDCEPEWKVIAEKGLGGCKSLSNKWVMKIPRFKAQLAYFDELICYLKSHGYEENKTLFGYSYDWR